MSESTKDPTSTEYIGQKGIGFKSVFKVSSVIVLRSRQFNIKFDRHDFSGMGYIIPRPIAPREDYDENCERRRSVFI